MTERSKHALTLLGKVVAALAFAAVGVFVLWHFHTTAGLIVGSTGVGLSLAIAFPTQFHDGALVLKEQLVLIVPVIVGAMKGGARRSDPPADPRSGEGGEGDPP